MDKTIDNAAANDFKRRAAPKQERRVKLYSYDSVAAQMLEPFGECALDGMTLEQIWKGTAKGNKRFAYHSHLAAPQDSDPWHAGAGISMTAAALLASVRNFRTEDMKNLILPKLYQKAVFALPGFESLRAATATERALIENRRLADATSNAIIPQPMLDLYYQRRQEDCGEFLVELLSDCPTVHSKLRGQEKAFLACTACGCRRELPTEHFLSMQVALVDEDRLLQSVQTAVNTYLEQQPLQEDVLYWECVTDTCLASGTARQAPRRLTTMEEWPENLVVTLKRWDGLRGLLSHKAHVD
eukprot:s1293_g5.t1